MSFRLRNCFSGKKEPFTLRSTSSEAFVYSCGSTESDANLLRHVRTFLFLDVLRLILRNHFSYETCCFLNVTNTASKEKDDDRTEPSTSDGGRRRNEGEAEDAKEKEGSSGDREPSSHRTFVDMLNDLRIKKPDLACKSFSRSEIVDDFVRRTCTTGFTYRGYLNPDRCYFDVETYLSENGSVFPDSEREKKEEKRGNDRDDADPSRPGEEPTASSSNVREATGEDELDVQIDSGFFEKNDPRDVTICRFGWSHDIAQDFRVETPEWHTECAALASFLFGGVVDVHVGEKELASSHHASEVAIGRCHHACRQWIRFCLLVGTVSTPDDLTKIEQVLAKGYAPGVVRWMFLTRPYGDAMDVTEDDLEKARKAYYGFASAFRKLKKKHAVLRKRKPSEKKEREETAATEADGTKRAKTTTAAKTCGETASTAAAAETAGANYTDAHRFDDRNDSDLYTFLKKVNDLVLDDLNIPPIVRLAENYVDFLNEEIKKKKRNVCYYSMRKRIHHVRKVMENYLGFDLHSSSTD